MAPQRLSVKNAAKILSSEDKNSDIERFLAYLLIEGNLRPLTLEHYRRDLHRFSQWCDDAKLDFETVTQRRLLDYLEQLSGELSARSRARHLSSLRQFFRWRVSKHRGHRDPTAGLQGPKMPFKLPDVLSAVQIEAVLGAVANETPADLRDRAMLELAYGCGLRVSELIGLCRKDVLWKEGLILVRGKGGRERLVQFGGPAKDALKKWISDGRAYIYRKKAKKIVQMTIGAGDFVFLNQRGLTI